MAVWRQIFAVLCLSLVAGLKAVAHPAHAEEVNHPFVAGFERFYSAEDASSYLAEGGEILLSALNCVACHKPPAEFSERFPETPAADLSGVGSRVIDPAALQLMIRNPRFLKRGTTMPSLFAGADRDEEELEALFQYLVSRKETPKPPLLLGNALTGEAIYHETGCVACHAPAQDYRPPDMPTELDWIGLGLPTTPIRFAPYYDDAYLTRFLMRPVDYHPAGLMPGLGLKEQEAAHLAAYLKSSPTNPSSLPFPDADPLLAARGRELYHEKGCANCHDGEANTAFPALTEFSNADAGCLAEEAQPGGVPYFYLGEVQRKALQLALQAIQKRQLSRLTDGEKLDRALKRFDCYACHAWQGRGGPELGREPFFGAYNPIDVTRERFLPPELDGLWERRSEEEVKAILTGKAKRYYPRVGARMPVYPEELAKEWIEWLSALRQR